MAWDVSADVVDFEEAIAFFRSKVPLTEAEFNKLDEAAQEQAFTVAKVTQLDLVAEVYEAIDSAIAQGTTLEDFKAVLSDAVKAAWSEDSDGGAWRTETVFRTNVQVAYGAGRYAQQTDPDTLADRPYWTFQAIDDDAECDICEPCDGTVLPADNAWWSSHRAPLHPNCRCDVDALTPEQAKERGIHDKGPDAEAVDGFGEPPELNGWAPAKADYPSALWDLFEAKNDNAGGES